MMAKTTFGPFPVTDVPRVEEVLEEVGVAYEIKSDETLLENEEEHRVHSEVPDRVISRLTGSDRYQPAFVFFEVEEADIPKIGNRLEPFGIVLEPKR